jgi:hypothetical protein
MKANSGERLVKICKNCRFWSMEKKGFCHYDNRGVGQFWCCEHWQAGAPGVEAEKGAAGQSCESCAIRPH